MRIEQKDVADPLVELNRRFRAGDLRDSHEHPRDIVYKLRDLDVRVSVL
jgi:hypothetical protein